MPGLPDYFFIKNPAACIASKIEIYTTQDITATEL